MSSAKTSLPPCVCLNLRMTSRALTQAYDAALRPAGVKITQLALLRAIDRLGPVSFLALAEELVLDQTTLPRSLRTLERGGLVRIQKGEDRRERLASLTPKGRALVARAAPHWQRAQDAVRARFPAEHWDRLLGELAEIRRLALRQGDV